MTNADKAFELLNKLDFEDGKFEITDALIEMAEWKDEQFAKEKQQLIDKACEWINDNYYEYLQPISCYEQLKDSIDIHDFVNDLKKAMKGE